MSMDMRSYGNQDDGVTEGATTEKRDEWSELCALAARCADAERAWFVFFNADGCSPSPAVDNQWPPLPQWAAADYLAIRQQARFYCPVSPAADPGAERYMAVPASRGSFEGLLLLEYRTRAPRLAPTQRQTLDILTTHGAMLWREQEQHTHQRKREGSSRRFLSRLKGMFDHVPIPINGFDSAGRCILWNHECERIFGWSFDELKQHAAPLNLFYPDPEQRRQVIATFTSLNSSVFREWRPLNRKGDVLTMLWANIMLPNGHMLCVGQDISTQKDIEAQQRLATSVFESSYEGIMVTDADNRITHVNPAFTRITGYLPEDVIGGSPELLQAQDHDDDFYAELCRHLDAREHWQGELWSRRKNGESYPLLLAVSVVCDDADRVLHHVIIFSDITHLKQHEAELKHQACHDALTRIPNRLLFGELLERSIAGARRNEGRLAVCYLDLDGFKQVNDSLGHAAGDRLLIEISRRLGQITRSCDALARLGGDEFALLFTGLHNDLECDEILDRVLAVIHEPMELDGQQVRVSASIGVALSPQDADDAELLLRYADQAMYQAKKQGKNTYVFFDAELHQQEYHRQQQFALLSAAFKRNEFLLYYQPRVDLLSKRMIGVEALLRWRHPQRGIVAPADFLPLIIGSELEFEVGLWVIERVLAQMTAWVAQGLEFRVSFNVSTGQLMHADFIDALGRLLARYPQVSPSLLDLEFQEAAVLADIDGLIPVLQRCRLLGLGILFDNFGTGYASLSHLNRLPVDTLKIDRSFVGDLLSQGHDVGMVESVIQLAAVLRMSVIADGMEVSAQGERLQQLGCQYVQGYGISLPMPAEQIEDWLQTWNDQPSSH
ncbi:sensor domain-containing protein [Oceanisphaera sediminis]